MTDKESEIQDIVKFLQTPESYKKNIKPYRQSCIKGDQEKMELVVAAVAQVIRSSETEVPMSQLNGVRLIKETLTQNNEIMRNLVQIEVLPILSKIAEFQKINKSDDRGKTYFSDKPNQDLQIIGNSFFRLVLECLLVWGLWFETSDFGVQLQNLMDMNVKFPNTLNYFKDVNLKELSQNSNIQFNQIAVNSSQINQSQQLTQQQQLINHSAVNQSGMPQQHQQQQQYEQEQQQNDAQRATANGNQQHQSQQQEEQEQRIQNNGNNNIVINNDSNVNEDVQHEKRSTRSFKDITQKDDVEKYKVSLKTGNDFRQISPTNSYYSINSSTSRSKGNNNKFLYNTTANFGSSKSLLRVGNTPQSQAASSQRGSYRDGQNNSGGFKSNRSNYPSNKKYNIGVNDFTIDDKIDYGNEIKKLHEQVDELTQDRDHFKSLYEQDSAALKVLRKQFEELKAENSRLEQENLQIQQQSASKHLY